MRYEQLKPGDIFADQFGLYIKTDFGPAVNLRSGAVRHAAITGPGGASMETAETLVKL